MKLYTILKNTYRDEQEAVNLNFFFANVADLNILTKWFSKILNATDIKKVWLSQSENDNNIFYVIYNEDFEKDFYHGYSIQILNTDDSSQYIVNKDSLQDLKEIRTIVQNILNQRGK